MKQAITRSLLGLFLFFFIKVAVAGNLGVKGGGYTSPYIGKKTYSIVWPIMDIDTGFLFLKNESVGFHLWRDSEQQLNALVQYLPLYLKPSSNDNEQVKQLDRRRSTLLGGISYQLDSDFGHIQASFLGDILNNSDSLIGALEYAYTTRVSPQLFLSPYLGAIWVNKKHNRYYFGISSGESLRSGFDVYQPNDSFNYYAGMGLNYYLNQHWSIQLDYRFYLLRDKIKSSPIVKHGYSHFLTTGIAFNF